MDAMITKGRCHVDCGLIPWARRIKTLFAHSIRIASLLFVFGPCFLRAQTTINDDEPWPRVRSTNGNAVTLYQPQVESWTTNWFKARAVVEVKPAGTKKSLLGVVWFEANGHVDHSNRLVTLDRLEIGRGSFPEGADKGSNALALVRELFPGGARTVSLDYLITALGFAQAAGKQATAQALGHEPPDIIWSTNRAVLVVIDGEPVFRPISGSTLERVINTPALMIHDKADNKFYLSGDNQWFSADSINGQWSLVQVVPSEVAALSPPPTNGPSATPAEAAPRIIVDTRPGELLETDGLPDFETIRGTGLQYAAHSDSQLFYDKKEDAAYLWISGRWFKAPSLQGPWAYVAPHDLPKDFAKIPPKSAQGIVLASVPDTPQAELAVVANAMPTTATVNRNEAKIDVEYDGQPQFKPIEGTTMSYAINAQLPVIQLDTNYYAIEDAVWFVGTSPTGPWEVATEVPEEIYTIPPTSPVYYATFARIYDSDTNTVEEGYTAGYTGAYDDDGTMVYGTDYDYQPYYGDDYYGWGWTWGYGYWYVPWYGWWTWRPWWGAGNGLRAAVIDNIYDRWQSRPGVTPHDGAAGTAAARLSSRQNYSGYPALYGRFKGATGSARFSPPANTIAINPYSRSPNAVGAGGMPRGAQLLMSVRQSAGGGRDLYASPDGNIYLRKNDNWYRQAAGGKWDFFAPAQGRISRGQSATGSGGEYRITGAQNAINTRAQQRGNMGANVNDQARTQVAAGLERQYYARQLGEMRAQNMQPAYNFTPAQSAAGRPAVRGGGRSGGRAR